MQCETCNCGDGFPVEALAYSADCWSIWLRVVIVEFPCLSLPIMCFWLSFQTRWLLLWIIHVLLTRHRSLLLFHWTLLQFQWVWVRLDSLIIVIPSMFIASSAMIFVYYWFLLPTELLWLPIPRRLALFHWFYCQFINLQCDLIRFIVLSLMLLLWFHRILLQLHLCLLPLPWNCSLNVKLLP